MKSLLALFLGTTLVAFASTPTPSCPAQQNPAAAMTHEPKITPFLWFDQNAEAAIRFYQGIFPQVRVLAEHRWGEGGFGPKGTLMTATFELGGREFVAMNGGPLYRFNESFSLLVHCETQAEVDTYWQELTADGGKPGQCGWLKDKFGMSWQVVPTVLLEMLQDQDAVKASRVAQAMQKMTKLDIATLRQAHAGR